MKNKLYIVVLLTLSLLFNSFPSSVLAQQQTEPASSGVMVAPDYYPQPQTTTNFLGQDHYYTVTFRGNGEAVVSAKMIFSNLTEATMSALTFRVPRVQAQDVVVYQVNREGQCLRYRTYPEITPIPYDMKMNQDLQTSLRVKPGVYLPPLCEEYQEPDYYQYWYGNNSYQKAESTLQADNIVINLPKPVKPNATGSLIIYYRAFGFAKKDVFGVHNFTFETLKTEDRIRTLQVGISTDSDLYMKGAQGNVNYGRTQETFAPASMNADAGASFKNSQFDNFINQIGQGTIMKTASNLQPLDSYTVKGSYAESRLSLYGKQITGTVVVIVLILVGLFFLGRFIYRRYKKNNPVMEKGKQTSVAGHSISRMIFEVAGLSFVSSILVVAYTLLVIFVTSVMRVIATYDFEYIFFLFIVVISCAVYALIILGPVLFMGMKRGFWRAVITLSAVIAWLVLYFFIFVVFFVMYRVYPNSGYYDSPLRFMNLDGRVSQTESIMK